MKKFTAISTVFLAANFLSAQYMIIGSDSIAVDKFKKEYEYGLTQNGIQKTLETTQNFILLQQFARDKKADTAQSFRMNMMQKEGDLRSKFFYPKQVTDPVIRDYVNANKTEREVQVFIVQKQDGDTTDFQKVYADVKAGKLSMQDAISQYAKAEGSPMFIKAGSVDNTLYNEIVSLPANSYTKLINNDSFAAFAKVLGSRPSLGYVIFGTVSYANDGSAEEKKAKIQADLKAGKKFEEVAKLYGSTEQETKNGGLVIGSPTLPNEVYTQFKDQKPGFTSSPVLLGDKYFIFHLYQVTPYEVTDKTKEFFLKDLSQTLYAENLQDSFVRYIKTQPGYKEFPSWAAVKKSYQGFSTYKNENDVLFQYKANRTTVGDLKKMLEEHKEAASKLSPDQWSEALVGVQNQNLMQAYSEDFPNIPSIKEELEVAKRMFYSDYIYSSYIKEEIAKNPQWLTDYYNKNKSKYMWGNRGKARVAIIADPKLISDVKKEIATPKKWDALKAKYYGKLNDKNQVLVHFEEGEMDESADVFGKYKVPFSKGVHEVRMGERDLVISIDDILQPSQMTLDEAKELVNEAVTEEVLNKITSEQRAKTKIVVEPSFMKELEKNFKK